MALVVLPKQDASGTMFSFASRTVYQTNRHRQIDKQ